MEGLILGNHGSSGGKYIFDSFFFGIGSTGYTGSATGRYFDLGFTCTDAYVELLYVYYGTGNGAYSNDKITGTNFITDNQPYQTKVHLTTPFRYIGTTYDNASFMAVIARNPDAKLGGDDIWYDGQSFNETVKTITLPQVLKEIYIQDSCHNPGTTSVGLSDGTTYYSYSGTRATTNTFPPNIFTTVNYNNIQYLRANSSYGVGVIGYIAKKIK